VHEPSSPHCCTESHVSQHLDLPATWEPKSWKKQASKAKAKASGPPDDDEGHDSDDNSVLSSHAVSEIVEADADDMHEAACLIGKLVALHSGDNETEGSECGSKRDLARLLARL
jgi:hypothetical protein